MLSGVLRGLDRAVETALFLIFLAFTIVGGLQVFNRFVLGLPLSWSEEFQKFGHIWMVFLAIPVAYRRGAHIGMDIVCFRFNPGGMKDEKLNALNKEILIRLHESGIAVPSYTTLNGRYCLRIAIANHRSRQEDFELLAREVVRLGRELVSRNQ